MIFSLNFLSRPFFKYAIITPVLSNCKSHWTMQIKVFIVMYNLKFNKIIKLGFETDYYTVLCGSWFIFLSTRPRYPIQTICFTPICHGFSFIISKLNFKKIQFSG